MSGRKVRTRAFRHRSVEADLVWASHRASGMLAVMEPLPPNQPPLRLFGAPSLRLADDTEHVFVADRPHQLLALLACRGDWVSRAELADWLWHERAGDAGLSNLRKVLLGAQQLLQRLGAPAIETRPGLLHWSPASDLRRFEQACDERQTGVALALWRSPLLATLDPGLSPAALDWLDFERARLAGRWRTQAASRLAELGDDADAAAELASQLLASDPSDEAALTTLVRTRLRQGRAVVALAELQAQGDRLRDQFGVEPSARLRLLADEIRAAAQSPLDRAPQATPVRAAPAADGGLVGRRYERLQLRDWLQGERRRLVSLVGPGGSGKTRLARAFHQAWPETSPSTAVWVPLADLADPAALPLRLAAALALPSAPARGDGWAAVLARLAQGDWLLILDNGEHLQGLADEVQRLLGAGPGVQVLHVSRERLSLPDEWLLPLDGLPLPDADERDPEQLRLHDAVALFEARATAASPAFDLRREAEDVVRFVHAVQGLPLAIEVGAALVRLLPVAQIQAELLDAATPLPALDTSFDLSWRGLSEAERRALVTLALLPSDVDRQGVEQVLQAPLAVMAALADKSLLQPDGLGRFGLHPVLRAWAARRAPGLVEPDGVALRLAGHVALKLERLMRQVGSAPQALVEAMRAGWSDVHAVWHAAVARADGGLVARMAPALHRFFELHGGWNDGIGLLQQALVPFADHDQGDGARARLLLLRALAALKVRAAQHADAEALARQALRLAQRLGDAAMAAASLTTLGLSIFSRGHYARARPVFEQALRRSRTLGDPARVDVALGNVAITAMAQGQFEDAQALFDELVARSRGRADPAALIVYLGNAGEALRGLGRWDEARAAQREALALCDRHGVRSRRCTKLLNLAALDLAEGRLEDAVAGVEAALADARAGADTSNEAAALVLRATLALDRQRHDAARADLVAALALARELGSDDLVLRVALVHGEHGLDRGDVEHGRAWLSWALHHPALYAVERAVAQLRLARRGRGADAAPNASPLTIAAGESPLQVSDRLVRALSAGTETPAKRPAP